MLNKSNLSINWNVDVIIPTLNEEKSIEYTLQNLRDVLSDPYLLVVDGNSADKTVDIATEFGAGVLLQNGKGKGNALRQAFRHNDLKGDMVVIIDADGSMDPREVPMFVKALSSGADVVKGSRFLAGAHSKDMGLIRKIGNSIFVSLVNIIWSTNYSDLCYGFMAFRKEALNKLSTQLDSEYFEIETEICIKAKKFGFRVVEVPSTELRRSYGKSHLSTVVDGFRILKRVLKEL